MLVGELREIIFQYPFGILDLLGMFEQANLEQQTFAQVPGSHSRRIKFLYNFKHIKHFLLVRLNICTE